MSRFFISLYTDEDVSVLIATLLRSRGYEAITTQAAGNTGRSDPEQLAFAAARQMTVLTHNRDDYLALFNEYLSTGKTHSGIIIAVRRSPYEIAQSPLQRMGIASAVKRTRRTEAHPSC